jgi:hypothetical protein
LCAEQVVLWILLLLVTDPGHGMRHARQKVERRRAAAAVAAVAGGDGHRATTTSLGARGAKAPSWLQQHLGDVAAALLDLSSVCTVGLLAAHDCRYIGRGKTKQTTEIYHNCNYMWSDNALYTYRADTHTQC